MGRGSGKTNLLYNNSVKHLSGDDVLFALQQIKSPSQRWQYICNYFSDLGEHARQKIWQQEAGDFLDYYKFSDKHESKIRGSCFKLLAQESLPDNLLAQALLDSNLEIDPRPLALRKEDIKYFNQLYADNNLPDSKTLQIVVYKRILFQLPSWREEKELLTKPIKNNLQHLDSLSAHPPHTPERLKDLVKQEFKPEWFFPLKQAQIDKQLTLRDIRERLILNEDFIAFVNQHLYSTPLPQQQLHLLQKAFLLTESEFQAQLNPPVKQETAAEIKARLYEQLKKELH